MSDIPGRVLRARGRKVPKARQGGARANRGKAPTGRHGPRTPSQSTQLCRGVQASRRGLPPGCRSGLEWERPLRSDAGTPEQGLSLIPHGFKCVRWRVEQARGRAQHHDEPARQEDKPWAIQDRKEPAREE